MVARCQANDIRCPTVDLDVVTQGFRSFPSVTQRLARRGTRTGRRPRVSRGRRALPWWSCLGGGSPKFHDRGRGAPTTRRSGAPDRRAVVADGGSDTDGRAGHHDPASRPYHPLYENRGHRTSWRPGLRAAGGPRAPECLLPAGPDLRGRVQVRHDAGVDPRPDRGACRWECARTGPGRLPRPPGRVFRTSLRQRHHSSVRAELPDAGCPQTLGRVFRRPGNGSDRSLRRIGRHTGHHHRSDMCSGVTSFRSVPGLDPRRCRGGLARPDRVTPRCRVDTGSRVRADRNRTHVRRSRHAISPSVPGAVRRGSARPGGDRAAP